MPPAAAVAAKKVQPLSDEDRRTIVRWIDLGCPLDRDFNPGDLAARGFGWMCDDNRPILSLTYPVPGHNDGLSRIVIGMHDYYTGLDTDSFTVTADFAVNGIKPGENLAKQFKPLSQGVFDLGLKQPLATLATGRLTVSVKDRQGNISRIDRKFSVAARNVAAK